jgi:hypothetical protein
VKGLWSLRPSSPLLVLSFVSETRVLAASPPDTAGGASPDTGAGAPADTTGGAAGDDTAGEDVEELGEVEVPGFDAESPTVLCADLCGGKCIVQVGVAFAPPFLPPAATTSPLPLSKCGRKCLRRQVHRAGEQPRPCFLPHCLASPPSPTPPPPPSPLRTRFCARCVWRKLYRLGKCGRCRGSIVLAHLRAPTFPPHSQFNPLPLPPPWYSRR